MDGRRSGLGDSDTEDMNTATPPTMDVRRVMAASGDRAMRLDVLESGMDSRRPMVMDGPSEPLAKVVTPSGPVASVRGDGVRVLPDDSFPSKKPAWLVLGVLALESIRGLARARRSEKYAGKSAG